MAKTLEDIAVQRFGQLTFSLIALEAEVEKLKEQNAALLREQVEKKGQTKNIGAR